MLEQLDRLAPENRAAWTCSRRILTRFGLECGTAAIMFERLTADLDPEDARDVFERLSMIYDAVNPLPQGPTNS